MDFVIPKNTWRNVSPEQFEEFLEAFPRTTEDLFTNGQLWRIRYGPQIIDIAFSEVVAGHPAKGYWINPNA